MIPYKFNNHHCLDDLQSAGQRNSLAPTHAAAYCLWLSLIVGFGGTARLQQGAGRIGADSIQYKTDCVAIECGLAKSARLQQGAGRIGADLSLLS